MVTGVGLVLGLLGNALSPRGLSLTRDYFPAATPTQSTTLPTPPPPPTPTTSTTSVAAAVTPTAPSPTTVPSEIERRLQSRGLRLGQHDEVERLYRDPRYEAEQIVFVDARKDDKFTAAHIPGAYPFDHYYPEKYLPDLLPACQSAELVVVYCTGGHCEDSEFAANLLKEAGVPAEKLIVYGGGIEEWTSRKLPLEAGQRRSGELLPPTP